MPLDPTIAALLQFLAAAGTPALSDSTPDEARKALRTLLVDMRSNVIAIDSAEDITVAGSTPARVYRPEGQDPRPTIVFLHGGGFVIGDLDTHDNACRMLARDTGSVVVSVDYPLAPEHHFPAAVDDSYAALRWVAEHIDDFGGDPQRLVVGGDSAGGNLAAVCAQLAHDDGLHLAAQLLIYPAVDMVGDYPSRTENGEGYFLTLADMQWFAENYVGMAESDPGAAEVAVDPRLSPLRAAGFDGLAPALVVTAEFDPLRDEGDAYAETLRAAQVPVTHRQFAGLIHGFYGMENISPAAAQAMGWIHQQLRDLVG